MVNTDKKILKKLPRKWADTIYDHFHGMYSKGHIRNVVNGNKNNIEIFEQVLALAEEYQKKLQSIKEKIDNLN